MFPLFVFVVSAGFPLAFFDFFLLLLVFYLSMAPLLHQASQIPRAGVSVMFWPFYPS